MGAEEEVSLWNVPFERNPYFTGREQILAQLHTTFAEQGKNGPARPQVLSGLGGIGKTQLAIEYAYRYRAAYTGVFWVRADTHEQLVSQMADLAQLMNLPTKNESDQNLIVASVKRWLQLYTGWLLILDNVEDLRKTREFLPPDIQGHVLFTARSTQTGNMLQRVEPGTLPPEEAVQFLSRRCGLLTFAMTLEMLDERVRQQARTITDLLGCLPLALDQAGAYIEETQCGLDGYVQRYQQRHDLLLQQRGSFSPEHPDSVAATWSLSFAEVEQKNDAAADILRLCAFLHPDTIPEKLIENARELTPALQSISDDWFARDEAIKALFTYSLIQRNPAEQTLSIHRLVQVVLKDGMNDALQQQWAEGAIQVVNRAFPDVDFQTWQQCQQLLPHAQTCAELIIQKGITTPDALRLLYVTGSYLHNRGQYRDAEVLLKYLLEMQERMYGSEHLDVASTLNLLGELARRQGHYKHALPLYQRALAIREQLLGPEHPDVATSLNNLARPYHHFAQYAQAAQLYQQALHIREQVLGAEHPDVAHSLNDLALLYEVQGKYQEALPLYERALRIRGQVLGSEHPDTAASLNNLAGLYREQGKYQEALPLFQRALAICEQVLGAEHPDTAGSLGNLAALYEAQGKLQKALPLVQRALRICEQMLGAEHPDTATCLNNLASLYQRLEKTVQAVELHKRSLFIREKVLGTKHPHVVLGLNNFASTYTEQRNFKQAEPLFQRALRIGMQVLGPVHPTTITTLKNYAHMLRMAKRSRKAEEMEEQIRMIIIKRDQGDAGDNEGLSEEIGDT